MKEKKGTKTVIRRRTFDREKKELIEECWNLDCAFLRWLRPRLNEFLRQTNKFESLDHTRFEYKGKTLTQRQIILRMKEILNEFDEYNIHYFSDDFEKSSDMLNELLDLWKLVFPMMWW